MRLMTDLRSSVAAAVLFFSFFTFVSAIDFRYHRYKEMEEFLRNFTAQHSNLARFYNIGKSIKGRELLVVELSAVKNGTVGVPNVKLIGNIHGNEAVGREVLMHFLEFMVDNYANNSTISWFLNNTRLHILPSLNPDGFEMASVGLCDRGQGRDNANNSDLNRSFPDFFRKNRNAPQPETEAVQDWMKKTPFILSASLHGGALVANYPYENVKEDVPQPPVIPPSVSPDDDVFQHLASLYANKHPRMHLGKPCPNTVKQFEGGITNGAAWYTITGGMQDYNYAFHGCMEITLEISCCKYPKESELQGLWEENKLALLDYIMEAHKGVKGQIIDGITKKPIARANLKVRGRDMFFYSTTNGEFWRLLRPNVYDLLVNATNYEPRTVQFRVPYTKQNTVPQMTSIVVELYPLGYTTASSTTDGSTEPIKGTEYNPISDNALKTINNSQDDTIGQEGLTAAVIQSHSFIATCSFAMTLMALITVLILK